MGAAQMKDRNEELRDKTVLPPQDPVELEMIDKFLAANLHAAMLSADNVELQLPDEVFQVLLEVLEAMSQGKAISLMPVGMQVTTSEAADILGISRPTLVRLLEDGALPYEQPRRHRLLRLKDVLAYKDKQHVERRQALAEMTQTAAEDGLYDKSYSDYEQALKDARKGKI
jgi:excisionase family DNA binding protein